MLIVMNLIHYFVNKIFLNKKYFEKNFFQLFQFHSMINQDVLMILIE